jgi:hypothetical protein
MAVRFDAEADVLKRTGGLGLTGNTIPYTYCVWVKRMVDRNDFSAVLYVGPGTTADGDQITTQVNGDVCAAMDIVGGGSVAGPTYVNGTWFFVAVVVSGTTRTFYWKTDGAGSLSSGSATVTAGNQDNLTQLWVGDVPWSGEWFNGSATCPRVWNAALSSSELLAESNSPTPVRTSNLQLAVRLSTVTDLSDVSGNSRNLTGGAGAATDTNEPVDILTDVTGVLLGVLPALTGAFAGASQTVADLPPLTGSFNGVVGTLAPPPISTTPITSAERAALVESAHSGGIDYDLHRVLVLDQMGRQQGDIVDYVTACIVEHDVSRTVHRMIDITLKAELDWGRHRIQPWVFMSGGGWTDDVPLGVFRLTRPRPTAFKTPPTFAVKGYDLLFLLDQQIPRPFSALRGDSILGTVRSILAAAGFVDVRIDASRSGDTLPDIRSWPVDEGRVTWLDIVNDLLGKVSYIPLHIDSLGRPVSAPIPPADQRRVDWRYDVTAPTTTVLDDEYALEEDTETPNFWRFRHMDPERSGEEPMGDEGEPFEYTNEATGDYSVDAQGGLTVPHIEALEAVSHMDLMEQGLRIVASHMHAGKTVTFTSTLNPYHGHRDILQLVNPDLRVASAAEHQTWRHDVFARRTAHTALTIAGGVRT